MITPLYLALVKPYLEFCAKFWATQYKSEIDNLEGVHKFYFSWISKSQKSEAEEIAWTIP